MKVSLLTNELFNADRQTDRHRQRDRQTDRQADSHRQRDRETELIAFFFAILRTRLATHSTPITYHET